MITFPEVFNTNTFATQIEPRSLAIMIAAAGFNLTGARNIIEDAYQYRDSRAAVVAKIFADCAQYVQRCYKKCPEARIIILGQGSACSALIEDPDGSIKFDPCQFSFSHCMPSLSYSYLNGEVMLTYPVLASMTIKEAVKEIAAAGFWTDRAWNWHDPKPRGQDYL